MTDDRSLLREYALRNSEDAFATLVSRHINLVYSVALRQTADPYLAEEITQVVFIILARKAASLNPNTILSGWLCRTARFTGIRALQSRERRARRELEASMQSCEPADDSWRQIAPLLETAMARLGAKDHDAIALRFFEQKDFRSVGVALGISEDAAKKRVARAVEKLRQIFLKRGVTLSAAAIIAAVSANSVQAAPSLLAKTVTAAAVTKGAATTASTISLMKGTLKIMAYKKASIVVTTIVVLLLLGGSAGLIGILPGEKGGLLGRKQQAEEVRQQMMTAKNIAFPAILGFAQAHNGDLPATIAELQSYLPANSGMDAGHWELAAAGEKVTPEFFQRHDLVLIRQKNVPPGQPMIIGYADGHFEIKKSGQ